MTNLGRPDHEVVVIGAGFSGLGAAIKLKEHGFHDLVILDKRPDIGGVWLVNTYPGVAVDIASFTYSFSFEPNPDWSRMFAPGKELKGYADLLADKYLLRPHLRLNTEVQAATWDAAHHLWRIETGGREITARFLINASGGLTQPKPPDIDGLADFTGTVMHTAEWDHSRDLRGRRVGIIGTGASALQVIPEIAPLLEQLYVYQRTPIWVLPKLDFPLPRLVRALFRVVPLTQWTVRAMTTAVTEVVMTLAVIYQRQAPFMAKAIEALCRAHLRRQIPGDPELRARLTPAYGIGCKRQSFSNTYLRAFTRDNVELVTKPIERITTTGIRTRDGREQQLDVLILATGFKVFEYGNLPPYPVTGRDGIDLGKYWLEHRYHSYEGTALPQVPNFWMVLGPYAFTGASWFSMIEYQMTHVIRCLTEARRRSATFAAVRQEPTDRFFHKILKRQRNTVFFNNNCGSANSYYFDANGDAPFIRPALTAEAFWRARHFPMTDYEFHRLEA